MIQLLLAIILPIFSHEPEDLSSPHSCGSIKALYSSLDPYSTMQNFAFYELYPETYEGRRALERAWQLLQQKGQVQNFLLPKIDLQPIISLVNRSPFDLTLMLEEEELAIIEKLGSHLSNRKLKGYSVWAPSEVEDLSPEEVDIARGLFLLTLSDEKDTKQVLRFYEAMIDLMALQILARLQPSAQPIEMVHAINHFIFHEMKYRFPPHSLWAKDIDLYTFLPSVIDSRRGVCLGVSILYLCIAQRLGLDLEVITPPGHIYVRYKDEEGKITNIETTARGIDVPSEMYLGIETRSLQTRNYKQVIGLAFINQASVSWTKKDYTTAVELYEKGLPFLKDDYLINELLAFSYLFTGQKEKGVKILKKIEDQIPDFAVSKDTICEDYLAGRVDEEGIQAIFIGVDETRESILKKQEGLEKVVKRHPKFRAGLLSLAGTHLQLGREKEALKILKKYETVDPNDSTVLYYLSVIHFERFDYNQSWKYLRRCEEIVFARDHHPKALRSLEQELKRQCPEPKL